MAAGSVLRYHNFNRHLRKALGRDDPQSSHPTNSVTGPRGKTCHSKEAPWLPDMQVDGRIFHIRVSVSLPEGSDGLERGLQP